MNIYTRMNILPYIGQVVKKSVGKKSIISGTLNIVVGTLYIGSVPLPDGNWGVTEKNGEYWIEKRGGLVDH